MDIDYTSDPYDLFKLFITDTMITTIKEQTNLYAEQKEAARFKPVTNNDINIFLYINMMFGIHQMPALHMYWSKDPLLRVPPVAGAINRDRFKQIYRYLHLVDNIPCDQSGHDPMYKVRPLIDQVLASYNGYYSPGVAVSIDEAMIPFQGRLHFKQYIQNKPNPWGVKVWCCCDPTNGYMLDFKFYTGKSVSSNGTWDWSQCSNECGIKVFGQISPLLL